MAVAVVVNVIVAVVVAVAVVVLVAVVVTISCGLTEASGIWGCWPVKGNRVGIRRGKSTAEFPG